MTTAPTIAAAADAGAASARPLHRSAWERFWYPAWPLQRLALFRIAIAWLCLYDAFLYDPTALLQNTDQVEATWHPLLVFHALGLGPPSLATTEVLTAIQQGAVLAMLLGWRTRTCCLVVALLAFWHGGVFYSLTKVRHDRVALTFATFALACAPSGGAWSLDAWRRRRAGLPPPDATWAAWPIVLAQVTIVIGYCAAGVTKLLHPGWTNGYTLQGIVLGHRGAWADVAAANVLACRLASYVTVAAETLAPLCLWSARARQVLVPLLVGFHFGTWATMDTGPYMTLWYMLVAFVALDDVPRWLRAGWARRPVRTALVAAAAAGVVVVVLTVLHRVVPLPMLLAAAAITTLLAALERPHGLARPQPA